MPADMNVDIFSQEPVGKAALKKLGDVPESFRLFAVEGVGNMPDNMIGAQVTGAEFRAAMSGPNKGKMTVEVKGTRRSVFVSTEEVKAMRQEVK